MKKLRKILPILLVLFLVVLLVSPALFGRAGGAGGRSGGSSRGGGSGGGGGGEGVMMIILLILHLPFPLNIIVAGLVVFGLIFLSKKQREQSVLNQVQGELPADVPLESVKGYKKFIAANPSFKFEDYSLKVTTAFVDIQRAWVAQDISGVRKFLSDGVYQRFSTQFKMMQLLKQKNELENIEVKNVIVDSIESDGVFDIIHTAIHAGMTDKFISEMDPSLNSTSSDDFVEYWSFIRKKGVEGKDMFSTNDCPNCGATLENGVGEVGKCEYCGTMLNSGEYDWVLSEITQADDYVGQHRKLKTTPDMNDRVRLLLNEDKDFTIQNIEDKASNGYLQVLTAKAMQDKTIMRRFVTDELFAQIKVPDEQVIFNRIYLNDVSLIGVNDDEKNNKDILIVAIKSSYQRVITDGTNITRVIDPVVMSKREVVFLTRDKQASASKGSLYTHNCPSCGATVGDSLTIECEYCGTPLNSTSSEWILSEIMDESGYLVYLENNKGSFSYSISTDLLDKLYDVRDYALNNTMIMIAADGKFADEEVDFVKQMARKWGFNVKKLDPMFKMAAAGRLSIKMPEKRKQKEKIFQLMKKAANADNEVSKEEQQLLDQVEEFFFKVEDEPAADKPVEEPKAVE